MILAAASTFFLNTIHGFNTGKFRKAAGIAYPAAYASNEVAKDNDDGKYPSRLRPKNPRNE